MNNSVIVVVTVNYCTPRLVINSLKALLVEREKFPNLYMVVVDNASPDDSVTVISQSLKMNHWDKWVKMVPADKNGGFSYGNNIGFKEAKLWLGDIDFFWMLNPDVEVLPNAISPLVSHLESNQLTIVGSALQDRDGTKQISAFNFPSIYSELCDGFSWGILDQLMAKYLVRRPIATQKEKCDWLAGASIMFSKKVFDIIGPMDETYFLYFEEVDYLKNARWYGVDCWYIPQSRVIHEVGAATGISNNRKQQPRRPAYWFESRRCYYLKHHGRLYLLCTDFFWFMGYCFWLFRKALTKPKALSLRPPRLLSDFIASSQLNPLHWFSK